MSGARLSRASSAGSATVKKRRPKRSPQVGQPPASTPRPPFQSHRNDGSELVSSPYDSQASSFPTFGPEEHKVEVMINTVQNTLDHQHKALEESKRILGEVLLSNGMHSSPEPDSDPDLLDGRVSSFYGHRGVELPLMS